MTVYVDNVRLIYKGKYWCHLVADSLNELHEFASLLGVNQCWFHRNASYPHYDITVQIREKALLLGAFEGNRHQIINCAKKMKLELWANKYTPEQLQLI